MNQRQRHLAALAAQSTSAALDLIAQHTQLTSPIPTSPVVPEGIWCCDLLHRCKCQGFTLHLGLGWGPIPQPEGRNSWRFHHDRDCTGTLVQLIAPQAPATAPPHSQPSPMQRAHDFLAVAVRCLADLDRDDTAPHPNPLPESQHSTPIRYLLVTEQWIPNPLPGQAGIVQLAQDSASGQYFLRTPQGAYLECSQQWARITALHARLEATEPINHTDTGTGGA